MKSLIQSPLLALLLAGLSHADAQTMEPVAVNNWFAINNKTGNTAYVQDGTTSSPTFKQVDGDTSLFVFSYFDTQVTLNDGESLSLTFDLTLTLSGEGDTKTFDIITYGLYKSVDLKASPSYIVIPLRTDQRRVLRRPVGASQGFRCVLGGQVLPVHQPFCSNLVRLASTNERV